MKKIQYILATLVLSLGLTSCGDNFLTQYPEGGVLLQDQYEKLPDNLQGSILGIYSKLYEYGGHSTFGLRSIDMYTDIQSGDMAMKSNSYGWFEMYERGYFYSYARSYLWSFYYDIINLANLGIMAVESNVQEINSAMETGDEPSETILLQGYYYGQLLAVRGWAYANLLNYFCDPMDQLENAMEDEKAIPVYTETEVKNGTLGEALSTVTEVYDRVFEDLTQAIDLLDFYSNYTSRDSKLEINADVARLMLAYAMLNQGDEQGKIYNNGKDNAYGVALQRAAEVINSGRYPMLTQAKLLTTGFADVTAENWLWGQDVTVETTTALGSFFGQVDVFSYSYAVAGDTKGIDSKLYDEIVATNWDARAGWFKAEAPYQYCPTRKFYCPTTKDLDLSMSSSSLLGQVDRNWLCDNVYMRVELAYLIAAEAAYRNNNQAEAKNYIKMLCDERVLDGKQEAYNTWLGKLTGNALKEAIIYNWRVEMWGEGYSMQLLRRLQKERTLGTNHITRSESTLNIADKEFIKYQCEIPTSETRYNPKIATTVLTKANN